MKKLMLILIVGISVVACRSNEETSEEQPEAATTSEQKEVLITFENDQFSDPKAAELLSELKICNPEQSDLSNYAQPACSPKFFHIQPFIENEPTENAFLLLVRSDVHDFPLRRLIVFQRERGKLVRVNTFVANLLATRKSVTKHDDLVLQFLDEYENRFECIYQWKENRYQYAGVEKINQSKIKKEFQDSMNVEIAKVINDNKMSS